MHSIQLTHGFDYNTKKHLP